MNKRKQNSVYDRPLRKGIKRPAGPKSGLAGLSHYGRNYKPTRQAAKKSKGGPKKYKAHHYMKPSF